MILDRMKEHYKIVEAKGYEIVGLFLQGSQNYGLEYEGSDIDTKCIILPSFDDFCLNKKPISTTVILDNDEHIDVKDIRVMFNNFKKQNINFLEILFTEYKILNPKYEHFWNVLLESRERIAHYDIFKALNCISGMSMQKFKALKHPYPSLVDKIEKFGYDPKQLHHIFRLNYFIKDYISGEPYAECLQSDHRYYMVKVKKGETHTLEEAEIDAKRLDDETHAISKAYIETNENVIDEGVDAILNIIIVHMIKKHFRNSL